MRIHFCGADRTVTGSSHLLEMNGLRVFLDMGIYQGSRDEARRINEYLPADVRTADAIILSHGHLDHCGKLPVATRAGFKGPIYCTPATAEVARIVLNDSAMIQMEDIEYLNRRTRDPHDSPASPLYTPRDIPTVLQLMRHVPYGQKTDLGKGVSFTFFDAGHILGSAYVLLEWTESGRSRSLLFTGDVGRYHTPIIRDPQPIPGPVEYLITESTYGNANHAPMEQVGPQFLDAVKFCVQHKSRLLIPSFAVGRTQTVLWYIQRFIHEKQIPEIPLFVDSPMGVEVSRIHSQFRDNYDKPTLAEIGTSDLFGLSPRHVRIFPSREQTHQQSGRPLCDHRVQPDVRVRPNPAPPDAKRRISGQHGGLLRLHSPANPRPPIAGWGSGFAFSIAGTM